MTWSTIDIYDAIFKNSVNTSRFPMNNLNFGVKQN